MRDSHCYREIETEKRIEPIMKTQMKSLLRTLALLALLFAPNLASAYYDPGVQRWINRDPRATRSYAGPLLRAFPINDFVLDLYSFNGNNPIGAVDYSGLFPAKAPLPTAPCPAGKWETVGPAVWQIDETRTGGEIHLGPISGIIFTITCGATYAFCLTPVNYTCTYTEVRIWKCSSNQNITTTTGRKTEDGVCQPYG
jgi:RHS repeat-associated protein